MAHWSPDSGANTPQLMKSDGAMVAMSDDNIIMKQIMGNHTPDGREVDVKPLFFLVQDILNRATFQVDTSESAQAQMEIKDKSQQAGLIAMIDAISIKNIGRISCEIKCKALGGSDAHATTVSLVGLLSTYFWEAKLVLTLAAFALNYGEFWLLAQIYPENQLAKSMAILKPLPFLFENSGPSKSRFDALNNLIKAMMDLTKCVIEFKELPSAYMRQYATAFSTAMACIPVAVYWTIRSAVACATQITMLTSMGHEFAVSTTEASELSNLPHRLKRIYERLRKQLTACYQYIDEKRSLDAYQELLHLFETLPVDNMKILRALIYAKDDLPLCNGASKKVSIDVLQGKYVLLFISGLDFYHEEISILQQIHNEARQHPERKFEVVWIPIVDPSIEWNEAVRKYFEKASKDWYTVNHPTLIENAVIKFIKEVWHFKNSPILVMLDPKGGVACPNAIHMMRIWGINAFPFTSKREEALWKEATWRLELLVDGVFDSKTLVQIREGNYFLLYGGDDLELMKQLIKAASSVLTAAGNHLQMVYVGKSTERVQVQKIMEGNQFEKLSHVWPELNMLCSFWTRLESMLFSKIELGRADDNDPMTREIKKLLSYHRDGGWAVLSNGSQVLVNGHLTTIVSALLEYDSWKKNARDKGFDVSFKEYHQKRRGDALPRCRLQLPSHFGRTPQSMTCPECLRVMKNFTSFCCCHDDHVPGTG